MDNIAKIYEEANLKISTTYGKNIPYNGGYVIVNIEHRSYIVYFCKIENGWNITGHKPI